MGSKKIVLTLEVGHKAFIRSAKETSKNNFTHDWEMFVQGQNNVPIDGLIERVIFHLHNSFPKPKRVVKSAPYHIKEMGYGGFMVAIDIVFKSNDENQRARITYDLYLQGPEIPSIQNKVKENITFTNVSADFRKKLLAAGASEVSHHDESRSDGKTEIQKPSRGAKTKPRVTVTKGSQASSSSENSTSRKSKNVESKKESNPKPKESKATDAFKHIFGEIFYAGQEAKPKKAKTEDKSSKSSGHSKEKKSKHSENKHKKSSDKKKDKSKSKSSGPKHKEKKSSHKESRKEKQHKSPEKSSQGLKMPHKEKESKKRKAPPFEEDNARPKKSKKSDKSKEGPPKMKTLKKSDFILSPKKPIPEPSDIRTPNSIHDGISPKRNLDSLGPVKSSSKKKQRHEPPPPPIPKSPPRAKTPTSPIRSSRSRSLSASISSSSPESTSRRSRRDRSRSSSSDSVSDHKSPRSSSSGSSSRSRSRSSSSDSSSSSSSSGSLSPVPRDGGPLEALINSRGLEKSISPDRAPSRNGQRSTPSEGRSSWRDDRTSPMAQVPTPRNSREPLVSGDSEVPDTANHGGEYMQTLKTLYKLIMEVFASKNVASIQDIVNIISDDNNLEVNHSPKEPVFQFNLLTSSKSVVYKLKEHFRI